MAALASLLPPAELEAGLAAAIVEDTAARMAAAAARDLGDLGDLDLGALCEIAAALADAGYRPRAEWQQQFEASLLSALAPPPGGNAGARLGPAALARGLRATGAWGRHAGPELCSAALEASRRMLPAAPPAALGPLLLALSEAGARPGAPWMCDWEGVTRAALAAAATGGAGGAAPGDVVAICAAAARAGQGPPGDAWVALAAEAAAAGLGRMTDAELAGLGAALHALRYRPPADWAAAVRLVLTERRAAGGGAELEAADAWFAALKPAA